MRTGKYDRISASDGQSDLQGLVPSGSDLDGEFTMVCDYTGESLRVRGWMVTDLEVIARGVDQ